MNIRLFSREVLAAVGSAGYGAMPGGAIDFTRVSRSPGSTLKPFIFALALHSGRLTPADVMEDLPEGAAGIGNAETIAWARLRDLQQFASKRDVPDDIMRQMVEQVEHEEHISELSKAVVKAGGLHVLGTERHESRRIDNQLRGRCARQGDPGSTQFFLALDDELMRLFGSDRIAPLMEKLGMEEGQAIEDKMVSRRIAAAQKKVEERHFDSRKNLLEYDEVMDTQRKKVYGFRQALLDGVLMDRPG